MRILYIADDGSYFDNEYDCEAYEFRLNHPHLKDVHIFDKDGTEFEDVFSDDAYNYSAKIVVTSEAALKDLQALEHYTGYCCYSDIVQIGTWVWDERKERFVMEEEQ